jgi:hypothetical protein
VSMVRASAMTRLDEGAAVTLGARGEFR